MKWTLKIRGKLKGFFYICQLHRITPSFLFNFFGHLAGVSRWIQNHKSQATYSDFYNYSYNYDNRFKLYQHVLEREQLDEFNYLEFGVLNGRSLSWWLKNCKNPNTHFYGFDTFTGLPEDWGPFKAGEMNAGNAPPDLGDNRCTFLQGLFQQTLHPFLATFNDSKRKVIHIDCDLYTSTLFVLTSLSPYLKPGDILFFDEFNVPMHEYKAFTEWVNSYYIQYELIGGVNNFFQVAFKLK
jgi:hypothetical protein